MPVTDRERDELRLAAQNYLQELREAYNQFKMQGREYLNEPEISIEDIEERIKDYAELRTNRNSQGTEVPAVNPETPTR